MNYALVWLLYGLHKPSFTIYEEYIGSSYYFSEACSGLT